MPVDVKSQRSQLRKSLRAARNALTPHEQQQAADNLCSQVLTALQTKPQRIAAYLANDGEISLSPLLMRCFQNDISVSLPVLHPFTGKHLLFQDYTVDTPKALNRFGISEPALNSTTIQPLETHTCLLMPLVGFDAAGNRLGMGGGFYDRTLASIQQLASRPALIGVAHDCQQVDKLPVQSWDIPLDMIITPTQIIRPSTIL